MTLPPVPPADAGRIAVLIPVYNERGALAATLQSLRGQGVPFTAVLVDDGSTPALSVDAAGLDFPVAVVRLPENRGIEHALNAGLAHIAARPFDYVARLDVGDRALPTRLARQQAFLDANPDVHLVGTALEWRRDDGAFAFAMCGPETHDAIARAFHHASPLIHPTVMFRTSTVAAVGPYSTAYPAAEDYEFFWRIGRRFRLANIPERLVVARLDPRGISITRRRRQLRTRLRIQCAFFRAAEPLSYVGVAKTLALLAAPYGAVLQVKRVLTRTRAA